MPEFAGDDYTPKRDDPRLLSQLETIRDYMLGHGQFRTLQEIANATQYPHASVSAQLRHLTRPKHGGYIKNRIYCGDGLYAYQIVRPAPPTQMELQISLETINDIR